MKIKQNIANRIDHTLLHPTATREAIQHLCREAQSYQFQAVCVPPLYVARAHDILKKTPVKVCTVIGFPLGYQHTSVKALEAQKAMNDGANEIDIVMNLAFFKSGEYESVCNDLLPIVTIAQKQTVLTKVIIETSFLSEDEKVEACLIVQNSGADFIKTSTGFGGGGATVQDVKLLSKCLKGSPVKIKASGGIRTFKQAKAMIQAGASRIGTSAGVTIVQQERELSE